jgi:hypothetical protein
LPVLLIPAIILQTGGNQLNAYARLGIVLPVNNKIILETENISTNNIDDQTIELKTRFTLGYNGAIGLSYKVGRHTHLWGEINMLSFNPFLKEGVVTKSTSNGVDNLSTLSVQQRNVKFEFSGTESSNNNNNSSLNSPDIEPTQSMPYSNIGIMAGLSFDL